MLGLWGFKGNQPRLGTQRTPHCVPSTLTPRRPSNPALLFRDLSGPRPVTVVLLQNGKWYQTLSPPSLSISPNFQTPLWNLLLLWSTQLVFDTRFQVIKQDMVTNLRKMTPALWRKSKSIPFPHPFLELPPFPPATLPHLSYLDRNPYV